MSDGDKIIGENVSTYMSGSALPPVSPNLTLQGLWEENQRLRGQIKYLRAALRDGPPPRKDGEMDDDFTQSFDARDWANAFVERVKLNPDIATDEGTMLTWFANALMRGYDEAERRARPGSAGEPSEEVRLLRSALIGIQTQCAGHADEFSATVWRLAERALGGGTATP